MTVVLATCWHYLLLGQFLTEPLDVPTRPVSLLWALPISLAIAVVYKAIKLEDLGTKVFLREVTLLFVTIVGFLVVVALALLGVAAAAR